MIKCFVDHYKVKMRLDTMPGLEKGLADCFQGVLAQYSHQYPLLKKAYENNTQLFHSFVYSTSNTNNMTLSNTNFILEVIRKSLYHSDTPSYITNKITMLRYALFFADELFIINEKDLSNIPEHMQALQLSLAIGRPLKVIDYTNDTAYPSPNLANITYFSFLELFTDNATRAFLEKALTEIDQPGLLIEIVKTVMLRILRVIQEQNSHIQYNRNSDEVIEMLHAAIAQDIHDLIIDCFQA